MYLSQHEANLLECSIFHYFIWRQGKNDAVNKQNDDDETTTDDTSSVNHSPKLRLDLHHLHSNNNYKRIINVLKKELPDIGRMSYETPNLLSIRTPEVCCRWLNNATLHNNNNNNGDIPGGNNNNNKKRKRDTMTNETINLVKALQSSIHANGEDSTTITLENAKVIISKLREEHTEVKQIADTLESKLMKSEKIYTELLKFHKKKIRLEKKLAHLQSKEEEEAAAKTAEEIILDNDHRNGNKAMEEVGEQEDKLQSVEKSKTVEGEQKRDELQCVEEESKTDEQIILDDGHHNVNKAMKEKVREQQGDQESNNDVRAKLETEKRKVQLQEALYANAILYEVDNENKEQQKMEMKGKMNREKNFELRLQQLIEFKQEFGHCQPGEKTQYCDLYRWLKTQRKDYRWKVMLPDRIAKLDALGMVWEPNPNVKRRSIDGNIEQCRIFKEKYGHLQIPSLVTERNEDGTEPSEDDIKFRLWAQSMRKQYQKIVSGGKNALNKQRIAILDNLGFDWRMPDSTIVVEGDGNIEVVENQQTRSIQQTQNDIMFRIRIEQLRKVKEIHGSYNVKKHVLSVYPNNTSIILWARFQRKQMKNYLAGRKSSITEERLEMLRSIDFDHDPRKHYKLQPATQKRGLTKMEKLALQLQEEKEQTKNNNENDSETDNANSDDDNSDID